MVQGTSDLVNWVDLGLATTNTTQSATSFLYRHTPGVPAPGQYYYRIRLP